MSWLTALKFIPWRTVMENAPTVLRTAKKLWDNQPPPDTSLQQEVASLREEAQRAAAVIESLAEQNARLVQAVEILRVRTRLLMYALGAVTAVLLVLVVITLATLGAE
jgi:hypothetical protein